MKYLFILLPVCLTLLSFLPAKNESCHRSGIKGYVFRVSGNQMPSPDLPPSKPKGMETTLLIYELTNTSQVIKVGDFYRTISTKLVEEIRTDENGFFKIKLKPGIYSLFVKKDDLFYSNVFDGHNNIHPVEVKKGKWTQEDFKADYGAVY